MTFNPKIYLQFYVLFCTLEGVEVFHSFWNILKIVLKKLSIYYKFNMKYQKRKLYSLLKVFKALQMAKIK